MRSFSAFIRNLSVSWKFILAYYLVLIIPMALFGTYFYRRTADDSISQAMLVMERNLLQTRASILQKVTVIENISNIIATNANMQSILYYEYENENDRIIDFQFEITPTLENINMQNNLIYAIRIYTPQTIFTQMSGSFYSIRKKDTPDWFDSVMKTAPQERGWMKAHRSEGNAIWDTDVPQEVFSFSDPVVSPVSAVLTHIGMVEIEIKESLLFDMLRDPVISRWGQVFVADGDGKIVSNNIESLYHKNVSELGIENYDSGSAINSIAELDGAESIVIMTPVEEIGCSIVGIFPVENFTSDVKKSMIDLLAVLAVLSVFLGIIIYIFTNILLRRVKKLVKVMKQVKENNLDVSVPVDSMDEFGELALSFNHMIGRIHELVETVYKIQLLERDAELRALEAQINPHFLYNTLATISWVARRGNTDDVVRMSNSLAKFYRLVLSKGGTAISVREEIDMVKAYLQIQKIRFGDMFDVVFKLDEAAMDRMIIKNLLQPMVENALNHGIEPKRAHGTIIISIELSQDDLVLQIIDDGVGMDRTTLEDVITGKVERTTGGYAVKNVIERLKAYYNGGHSFEACSRPGIGSQFIITIKSGE